MKNSFLGRALGTAAALCCFAAGFSGCGSASSSSENAAEPVQSQAGDASLSDALAPSGRTLTENAVGEEGDYSYSLWKDNGTTSMTLGEDGAFSCEWSNINNALFRRGKQYDCTKTFKELGDITIDYGVDYQPNGNSYLCVYGWSRQPLVEYYIVETWGSWRPPGSSDILGVVTVDGGEYEIYKTTRFEQPSIDGTKTFDQFWSVRRAKKPAEGMKIEGTISVSRHFQAWEKAGLELGKMYEVTLNVEGYQSQGKANIYKNVINISDTYNEDPNLEVTVLGAGGSNGAAPEEAGEGFFSEDFESGEQGKWQPRGDGASVSVTKDKASAGSSSLKITGRSDDWMGTQLPLDTGVFKPGEAYSFSADILQESGETAKIKITLQYNLNGNTKYDGIAEGTADSGVWTTLSNGSFTIPEGATNVYFYAEIPGNLTDFYLDNAAGNAATGS